MSQQAIEELSPEDLMEQWEYATRRAHYDPMGSEPPMFSRHALQEEVLRRIKDKK
jgi:hypothetical protein